jgi:hypothetical protein
MAAPGGGGGDDGDDDDRSRPNGNGDRNGGRRSSNEPQIRLTTPTKRAAVLRVRDNRWRRWWRPRPIKLVGMVDLAWLPLRCTLMLFIRCGLSTSIG